MQDLNIYLCLNVRDVSSVKTPKINLKIDFSGFIIDLNKNHKKLNFFTKI